MLESQLIIKRGDGEITIDYNKVKKSALILRALNHRLRRVMIETIAKQENGITVTDLYVHLRLEQSVASQHLAILRRAGIVRTRRNGKQILYSINADRLEKIINTIEHII
jgi:DNA-binding transcriptional ArsR family regulator